MAKQTAVDWIIEQLQAPCRGIPSHIIEQAKQMEKKQIIDAVDWGNRKGYDEHTLTAIRDLDEQYYNEIYGKE